MKKIFAFILLILSIKAAAQREESPDRNRIDFSKFRIHKITLHKPSFTVSAGCMFADIIVEDNRFDTSTLGFMHKGSIDPKHVIRLKNGFTNEIRNYLISSIDRPVANHTASYKLICIIKKLWLSDEIYDEKEDKYQRSPATSGSGVIFRIEYLAEKDNFYIPLYRLDSTITGDKNIHRDADLYIEDALTLSLSKLRLFTESKIEQITKRYTLSQVEQYNKERFNIAILNDSLQKGIYLTFDELRNNKPSVKEFVVKAGEKNDDIYIKNALGKEILIRELYGYSDGKNIFISSAGSFFRLYRSGNTFNFYGAKLLKKVRDFRLGETAAAALVFGGAPALIPYNTTKPGYNFKLTHNPYQLDMETGDIY
ncbi:MAG: hypothetical protein BGP13_05885 [Sphingobacteriales bacterium 40-81]|nr:MAG: hypothetical protein BGP13_05885 [Sphingobacteriales bacterium 40-81]